MSEATKSIDTGDAPITSRDSLDRPLDGPTGHASPSVRELLAELAQLEDATRGLGGVPRPRWTAQSTDLLAALAREQEIIDELRRRCPDAQLAAGSSADDDGAAWQPD